MPLRLDTITMRSMLSNICTISYPGMSDYVQIGPHWQQMGHIRETLWSNVSTF